MTLSMQQYGAVKIRNGITIDAHFILGVLSEMAKEMDVDYAV